MFSIYLLLPTVEVGELLKHKGTFVVISAEYVAVPRFVEYAFIQAFKTFEKRQNTAKTINLEWLCKLALTKNVSNAVNFTRPKEKEICLAAVNCFESAEELKKIGEKIKETVEFRQKAERTLQEKYAIPAKALDIYTLEDLLVEKAAVENI